MIVDSSPGRVLDRAESELRQLIASPAAPGQLPSARACTMNLVVVGEGPSVVPTWEAVIDEVLLGIPARAVLASLTPAGEDSLGADLSAVCTPPSDGGPALCSERITLHASGRVCERLPSCVAALSVTDVPSVLVWLGRIESGDPVFGTLAADASRIVLDSADSDLSNLARVLYWARARAEFERPGVADLAWTRLAPWQELLARFFDEPKFRPLAARVTRLVLCQASAGGRVPLAAEGTLLLAWFATRLGWRPAETRSRSAARAGERARHFVRPDGGIVALELGVEAAPATGDLCSVRVDAEGDAASVHGTIRSNAREGGAWRLEWRAHGDAGAIEQCIRLRDRDRVRLLERTLHRPAHDSALAESVAWADELRSEELACSA
jgi:glucose-6-phosphate dehydrogenase assembly protein OpcA